MGHFYSLTRIIPRAHDGVPLAPLPPVSLSDWVADTMTCYGSNAKHFSQMGEQDRMAGKLTAGHFLIY